MERIQDIREILRVKEITSEETLQYALLLEKRVRLLRKEDASLNEVGDHLYELIHAYETAHWSNNKAISEAQFHAAEKAAESCETDDAFVQNRKSLIRKRLKRYDMNQQDLGYLLGHSKTYISELMNGVSQFTLKDLVIIHKVLDISIDKLVPTSLQKDTRNQVKAAIEQLNKPKLLQKSEAIFSE